MKHSIAAQFLFASCIFALPEISIEKRNKRHHGKKAARGMVRRQDDTLETTVFSGVGYVSGGAYYANITVGTPPQLQTVLLDTGSSDLYLDDSSSDACQSSGPHSCVATDFTPGQSSTYEVLFPSPAFNATYGDGSTAIGPYVSDTVCINNICIDDVQFGLATEVNSAVGPAIGLFGVGFSYGEAITAVEQLYPNVPDVLVNAGVINSRLYSLYLNDYGAVTGSILFGGIDLDKYTGELETVNIVPDFNAGAVYRFITTVTGLKTTSGGSTNTIFSGGAPDVQVYSPGSGSLAVLLDSGSSAWSVPTDVYLSIVNKFKYIDPRSGLGSCNDINDDDHITVTFNEQIDIDVPITEWFIPIYDENTGEVENLTSGEPACAMAIIPGQDLGLGFLTMGDAVMRSMYIIYDLANGQMSLAQANVDATSSNIKAVPAGPDGVQKVAKSYQGNPGPNSYSVAPSVSATVQYETTAAETTVGTATGIDAVPTEARVEGLGSESGSGSSSDSGSDSGAVTLQTTGWSAVWMTASLALFGVIGAGMIL